MDSNNEIGFILNCLEFIRKNLINDNVDNIATGVIVGRKSRSLVIFLEVAKPSGDPIRFRLAIGTERYAIGGYYIEVTKINSLFNNVSTSSRPWIYVKRDEIEDIISLIEDKTGNYLFDMLEP